MRELAEKAVNPHLVAIATLSRHAMLIVGTGYTVSCLNFTDCCSSSGGCCGSSGGDSGSVDGSSSNSKSSHIIVILYADDSVIIILTGKYVFTITGSCYKKTQHCHQC
jgi:hypothetical protein